MPIRPGEGEAVPCVPASAGVSCACAPGSAVAKRSAAHHPTRIACSAILPLPPRERETPFQGGRCPPQNRFHEGMALPSPEELFGALIEEVRFALDSPLEETVLSELVSETQIPW
jgi:hypothetical protein